MFLEYTGDAWQSGYLITYYRMKCIEFLYFYLLPEQSPSARCVSSTSSASSSSGDSRLFPPSPLSTISSSTESDGRVSPSPAPSGKDVLKYADIDMPFIPQTPRKVHPPSLGYLTPSNTRRTSGYKSLTPGLPTVPASPRVAPSPSSRYLDAMAESMDERPSATPKEKHNSAHWARPSHANGMAVGLGFDLPKSTSIAVGMSHRDVTSGALSEGPSTPTFSDPFSSDSRSSSGSSTVLASPRSSTQPSLIMAHSSPRNRSGRQTSIRQVSRSPLIQSLTPDQPASPDLKVEVRAETVSQSKHSRSRSHLSGLPAVLPIPNHQKQKSDRHQSLMPPTEPTTQAQIQASRPRRAFPAELTRGLPSSTSSPNLASPLSASKRIPSDTRPSLFVTSPQSSSKRAEIHGEVRSVAEKKELVSHVSKSWGYITYMNF